MSALINKTTNQTIVQSVTQTFNLKERMVGLLGKKEAPKNAASMDFTLQEHSYFFYEIPN